MRPALADVEAIQGSLAAVRQRPVALGVVPGRQVQRGRERHAVLALADLLDEPPAGRTVGCRRVELDATRQQPLEEGVPALEHGGEERRHGRAPLVPAEPLGRPLALRGERVGDAGGVAPGRGVGVAVDEERRRGVRPALLAEAVGPGVDVAEEIRDSVDGIRIRLDDGPRCTAAACSRSRIRFVRSC